MYLREALSVQGADDLDENRSIEIGRLRLGPESATEAKRILAGGDFSQEVAVTRCSVTAPIYWSITHKTAGAAELFWLPKSLNTNLPTAIELALVRALAAATPDWHERIVEGDVHVAIGAQAAWSAFRQIVDAVDRPLTGKSVLFDSSTEVIVDEGVDNLLTAVALKCLANSFVTRPIKFRFLELYRVMEARFLADVKARLIASFDIEPGAALADATDALRSELNQIISLAEAQQDAFQACWLALHGLKSSNRFAAALFRRLAKKNVNTGGVQWKIGAALIYQIRCAIVHAGEKDIIFESFPDGDAAIEDVLVPLERASLALLGFTLT